jgi:ferredoxin-type protein NapH
MKALVENLLVLFGKTPRRPERGEMSQAVQDLHAFKKSDAVRIANIKVELKELKKHPQPKRWRRRRWAVLIAINLLFVLSYRFDVQLLEGSLTASRFMGFHMADLHSSLQVMLAYKHVLVNLLIGTVTVFLLWVLLGGRTFCSWVCPYHLVAEWAESLHLYLARRNLVRDHRFHRGVRGIFFLIFSLLALVTGYTVFETFSPTGILSRALIYGPGLALVWVAALLLFEIFYSRRAWCRYVCPIGLTYGVVGALSPVKVTYHLETCFHEGECRKVCMVPHVLDTVIKGRAGNMQVELGADCTRCGRCVETCPTKSLTFQVKGLQKLL